MRVRAVVLIVAGTDCSGGAGLSRDVQTLADFRVAARCAVTAVTVQTDGELLQTQLLAPQLVRAQMRAALQGGGSGAAEVGAIKIGMLGSRAIVEAVADELPRNGAIPIVLDPVLASTSGGTLLDADGEQALLSQLLPRVTLLTPNLPEAAVLLREQSTFDEVELIAQAQRILNMGPSAVLLKGGHGRGATVTDLLLQRDRAVVRMTAARVQARGRGTGCALASAIAAQLAQGQSLADACLRAQAYVIERLVSGS